MLKMVTIVNLTIILATILHRYHVCGQCEISTYENRIGFCTIDPACCKGFYIEGICLFGDVCCYGRYDCSDSTADSRQCPVIITRNEWKALNSLRKLANIRSPVTHVFIHHTAEGSTCDDINSCKLRVRSLQSYHQRSKKWPDIAWNFLIGGNGEVYEGIGWTREGFHTLNWNSQSLGIAMIGNFDSEYPSAEMTNSLARLLNCGKVSGYIGNNYLLHGHRDARQTSCPGINVYEYISGMPHFQSGPLAGYE